MFQLKEKVCLVTGGTSGIGLACVKELLKNGVKGVSIIDLNEEMGLKLVEEIREDFGENKLIFIKADVSDTDQFDDAFKKTVTQFGNIDVLINNAGIYNEQQWKRMIDVNLNGLINGNLLGFEKYITKHRSGPEGVIINISSISGVNIRGNNPIYTATKFGVIGLSRSLGIKDHYDRTKIKVITVCPGLTDTSLVPIMEKQSINEHYVNILHREVVHLKMQPTSHVSKVVIDLIENGKTGSVWVVEDNEEPYELEFPSRKEMRKK